MYLSSPALRVSIKSGAHENDPQGDPQKVSIDVKEIREAYFANDCKQRRRKYLCVNHENVKIDVYIWSICFH